jgi:DNA-directed RNA polymerase alpha subunit
MYEEPPTVHSEDQLRTYGRKVAARLERFGDTEPQPDFARIRKIPVAERKQLPIRALGIQNRTVNMLEGCDIFYIWQLLHRPSSSLLCVPNVGERIIAEIKNGLDMVGLLSHWN